MNYKDSCRTCLASDKEMRNIHTTAIVIGDENVKVSDLLKNFYKLKVSSKDSYPDNICLNCIYQLSKTYSFKKLIESSTKTLEESSIVLESQEPDVDYNYESDEDKLLRPRRYKKQRGRTRKTIKSEPTVIFCVECKAEFLSSESLSEHCLHEHPVKSSTGKDCDYCHEKFEDFRSLVLHRKLHLKPYLCENCLEGFDDETSLISHSCRPNGHQKKRNNSERELRKCEQCGNSYPLGYIRVHMQTHSNDRPYKCKYCPKKFKVRCGLNSHVLWNHKRTRNFKCEVCDELFISSSARSIHIRKNHLKERKYGCESCDKRFFGKSALDKHSSTHTGVKPFQCHLCDQSYYKKYRLTEHLKSHSETDNVK